SWDSWSAVHGKVGIYADADLLYNFLLFCNLIDELKFMKAISDEVTASNGFNKIGFGFPWT
ncbi:MAG TPA: hypothetical protein O0X45_06925, partial [Methanocorpusculum sp.]|nr:hypothetical protein [Methanocorpusculum sp.]